MVENKDTRPSKLPDPETWVDEYGDYLYRFALSRVKDPLLAEELVHGPSAPRLDVSQPLVHGLQGGAILRV